MQTQIFSGIVKGGLIWRGLLFIGFIWFHCVHSIYLEIKDSEKWDYHGDTLWYSMSLRIEGGRKTSTGSQRESLTQEHHMGLRVTDQGTRDLS